MSQTVHDPGAHRPQLVALFDAFVGALCDAEGGAELYRIHAADALVRHGSGLATAAQTDPESFALAHRQISLLGQQMLPRFAHPAFLSAAPGPDATLSIAWFELTELRDQRPLVAALGVRTLAGVARIVWCTLAQRGAPWSYQEGLLQSIADYPWMRSASPAAPRVLLDAGYFRRHWRSPVKFSALPNARFSCQMSAACCKHDFEITLPPEAQLLIDAMPWQTLKPQLSDTQLPVRSDGKLQLKALDESCRFLGAVGQCLIHQTLGRQPFGTCCVYPFSFAHTPEGVAVGLSPICGSVRLGMGMSLQDREEDLRERLVHAEPRRTERFRLTPGIEIAWERFRDIEKGLCDCLAADDTPMRRRLYVGAKLLASLSHDEPIDLKTWLAEPPVQINPELREAIRGMLERVLGWQRAALRSLSPGIPADLFELEVRDPVIVMRILQNALFCKVYSYPFDLTTAYNLLIVLYLLTLIFQAKAVGPLSDVMWRELGSLGVHGLLASVLHEGVPEGFRALFGTADFGLWMLAA